MATPRIITREEVQTYANALIVQYVEKRGITELSQLGSSSKSIAKLKGAPKKKEDEINDYQECLPPIGGDPRGKFNSVLESIIYTHLCRAYDDQSVFDSTPQRIKIQDGLSVSLRSPMTSSQESNLSLPEVSPLHQRPGNVTTPTKQSARPRKRATSASNGSFSTPTKKTPPKDESTRKSRIMGSKTVSPFQRRKAKCAGNRGDERPQTAPCGTYSLKSLGVTHPARLGKSRSSENWIPDHIRERMLQRDLSVAKQNLEFNDLYQRSSASPASSDCGVMGTAGTSPLERSRAKEKFGLEQRKPCGLCCMLFLPVNLVMAVPLKAVFDMRDTWGEKFDPVGQARGVRVNPNLKRAPACYDRTSVCAFCAQLFDQQQETYRPSWEAREAEKERERLEEEEAKKKVMSDPLKQVDQEAKLKLESTSGMESNG